MSRKEKATREYLETLSKDQVIDLCLQFMFDVEVAEKQLDQANKKLERAIVPKFKIGQTVWYISQNNDNVYEFNIKEMVFTRCKDGREMLVYCDEHCAEMYEYELYLSKEEAEKKLQGLRGGE